MVSDARQYRRAISQEVADNIKKHVSDQPMPEKQRVLLYMKCRAFYKMVSGVMWTDEADGATQMGGGERIL